MISVLSVVLINSTFFNGTCSQFFLVLSKESSAFLSGEIFENIKINSLFAYKPYNFNIHLYKTYNIVREVLTDFPSLLSLSVIPFDLALQTLLEELRKRLFLLYNSFFLEKGTFSDSSMFFSTCGMFLLSDF